ncbi:TetR/AcrR family transcriptional regulator [Cytobacillus praedii]|uniref:TetR/AcrR family transcriptional regulator n=1 Tax=Cytobacillus praedii TaxID=1742358 RepID=A0A4R1AMP4_9BACI|nr:TetR/AcrR family transcriptional regulator [Cytobacillus praedii]TCJ00995.1 TetR/AcrR family transcriptional regulator [Cytobacillus praedii]
MRNKEATYGLIVETAYKLFAENGFDKTSLAMIAKEVGISKPAIYYYFDSKEKLIDFLFEEICKEIIKQYTLTVDDLTVNNFEQFLLNIGFQMIEEQERDVYFNKIFNEYILLATRKEKYMNQLNKIQRGYFENFSRLMNHGVKIGVVNGENVESKSNMLVMVIDNIGNFILTGLELDYKGIWEEAVKSVLKGVRNG